MPMGTREFANGCGLRAVLIAFGSDPLQGR
jgi:hypothetical protein